MSPSAPSVGSASPALLAGQERLLYLRRQYHRSSGMLAAYAEASLHPIRSDAVLSLPASGAGVESEPFTRHIRAVMARRRRAGVSPDSGSRQTAQTQPECPPHTLPQPAHLVAANADTTRIETAGAEPTHPGTITLFPDLALAMLREKQVSTGRLWMLLRVLDSSGRGWIYQQTALEQLAQPGAALRFCGRRRLRQLLSLGEGLFWERSAERPGGKVRIWLRATARVALALGCRRLSGRPVALPVMILRAGIGAVRAHFYASFHSGRGRDHRQQRNESPQADMPIARATLRDMAHVCPQTQRAYEARSGVRRQSNWALGPIMTAESRQEVAWRRGSALFVMKDKLGLHGRPGRIYLAWQMPNSYVGPHERLSRNQTRRVTKQLADLSNEGTTGNGKHTKTRFSSGEHRYFRDARRAVQHSSSGEAGGCFWRGTRQPRCGIFWHHLSASDLGAQTVAII